MPPDPPNKPAADMVTVLCLHCGKAQEVARRAQTVTCKHCYKRLELQDVVIARYEARRAIETTGVVTVEKKGQVIADRIHCGGLIVRGKVKGEVTSRGPVLVGPDADLIGDVTAPTMAVGAGAVLNGYYEVGKMKPKQVAEPEAEPLHIQSPGPAQDVDAEAGAERFDAAEPVDPEA